MNTVSPVSAVCLRIKDSNRSTITPQNQVSRPLLSPKTVTFGSPSLSKDTSTFTESQSLRDFRSNINKLESKILGIQSSKHTFKREFG